MSTAVDLAQRGVATASTSFRGEQASTGRTAAAGRAPEPSRSIPEALTSLQPSNLILRLPLLKKGTSEAAQYAEDTRQPAFWERTRRAFEQERTVAAVSVPARETGPYQNHALLKDHVLNVPRIKHLVRSSDEPGRMTILLSVPSVEDLPLETQQFLRSDESVRCGQSKIKVGYGHFGTDEVLSALLPKGLPEGTPTAFTTTGHIAHVNLRDEYLPYRYVIGQVILDKNAAVIRTVVNKLDTIDNEFRFFKMERLAGADEYVVSVSESGCTYTFDFRTVYWNSRLHTEHARLIDAFQPFDVVSDVMAGVGPFAVPAAKRGCYVVANDLNPASYESLMVNGKKNRAEERLRSFCEDGRSFIRNSVERVWKQPFDGRPSTEEGRRMILSQNSVKERKKREHARVKAKEEASTTGHAAAPIAAEVDVERGPPRRLIDHFIMNLPSTALGFLDAYRGAYKSIAGDELEAELQRRQATNGGESIWPMVHVHCFTKNLAQPHEDICNRANAALGIPVDSPHRLVAPPSPVANTSPPTDTLAADAQRRLSLSSPTPELSLHHVRSVAPNKDMYCLSFRLSRAILFDTL